MRLNVEIKREIYEEFQENVENGGRSLSDVVRELINKWNAKQRLIRIRKEKSDGR